jgi:hypothetical protein
MVKFCFKTGKTATETFQLIKQAHGGNSLSLSRTLISEWYAKFRDSCENLEDDERSGRPTTVRTPDMIETVRELISTDRRMTLDDGRGSIVSFISKNSSSKTSVSGQRIVIPLA